MQIPLRKYKKWLYRKIYEWIWIINISKKIFLFVLFLLCLNRENVIFFFIITDINFNSQFLFCI